MNKTSHQSSNAHSGTTTSMSDKRSDLLYESYDLEQLSTEWRRFFHLGISRKLPKGTTLLFSGDRSDKLMYLDKGEIRVVRQLVDGREKILFRMHEGMLVAEVPFFDNLPTMSHVVAADDSTIWTFDRKTVLEKIFPENPGLAIATMKAMASKIRMLCNQSVEISTSELSTRICRFILMRARKTHSGSLNGKMIAPSLNQQELSSLCGVHRVTLNKALRELENQGIIGPYSKKELYILDEKSLEELANLV